MVAVFVVRAVQGRAATGASSPEAAVANLLAAVQAKDLTAIAGAINPYEERQLVSFVQQAQSTSAQAGITSQGQELSGVDVAFEGLTFQSTELSTRVAKVKITGGRVALKGVDAGKLPAALRGLNTDYFKDPKGQLPAADVRAFTIDEFRTTTTPFVMAVREETGWFVSPLYTAAELGAMALRATGTFSDTLPTPTTESTPEAAVKAFLEAAAQGRGDEVVSRLAPQEQAAIKDYEKLWRPALERQGVDARDLSDLYDGTVQVSLGKTIITDLGGGVVGVALEGAEVTYRSTTRGAVTVSLEKDCLTVLNGYGDETVRCLAGFIRGAGLADERVKNSDTTAARLTMVTVPAEQGYAVSLLGTTIATGRSLFAGVDATQLVRAMGLSLLLPTSGSLTAGQQLTVDPTGAHNLSLTITERGKYVVRDESRLVSLSVWDDRGSIQGLDYSAHLADSDGHPVGAYHLEPGTYRITWDGSRDLPGHITVSVTQAPS